MPARYDATTIRLHWATAILVTLLWSVAQVIDRFPVGEPRWNVRSVHMVLGLLLLLVLAVRLWWRATRGRKLEAAPRSAAAARAVVHSTLYLLMIAVIVLGICNAWVRGDHVFALFQIRAVEVPGVDLRRIVGDLHAIGANSLLVIAAGHAVIALIHGFVLRDGVLARMLPQRAAR